MTRALFLRTVPCPLARDLLRIAQRDNGAACDLLLQESSRLADYPGIETVVRVPDGPLEPARLAAILERGRYDKVYIPLASHSPRGTDNLLEGTREIAVRLLFADGTLRSLVDADRRWARMKFDEEEEWGFEEALRLDPRAVQLEPGPPSVVMIANRSVRHDSRVERHAAALAAAGIPVTLVSRHLHGVRDADRAEHGVRRVYARHGEPHDPALLRRAMEIPALAIHVHDINALHIGARVAAARGVPLVYCAYDCWWCEVESGMFPPALQARYQRIEELFMPQVSLFFSATALTVHACRHRYGRPVELLRNCVARVPGEARAATGPIIAFTGTLHPSRHLDEILEALSLLPPAVRLRIWAPGGDRGAFLERARDHGVLDRIEMRAPLEPSAVAAGIRDCWAGIVPAFTGGVMNEYMMVPTKFYECVAAGLPVIAGNAPELAGLVRRHGLGIVAASAAPHSLAEAITTLRDQEVYARCRRNLLAARDLFSWERESQTLVEGYAALGVRAGSISLGNDKAGESSEAHR